MERNLIFTAVHLNLHKLRYPECGELFTFSILISSRTLRNLLEVAIHIHIHGASRAVYCILYHPLASGRFIIIYPRGLQPEEDVLYSYSTEGPRAIGKFRP